MTKKNNSPQALIHSIDAWLWRRGFRLEKVRFAIRTLFLLNILFLFVALVSLHFTNIPLSFALASLCSSFSFFTMAKKIIFTFPLGGASNVTLFSLLNWGLRLALLLIISLVAVIKFEMPAFPWFVGLGIPILILPLSFGIQSKK